MQSQGLAEFVPPTLKPYFDGLEMPFPRFGPVFTAHFRNCDFAGTSFQPAIFNLVQPNADFCAPFSRPGRFSPAIGRDRAHAGFQVEIGRNRLTGHRAEKFRNRVFGLRRRNDGNAPERLSFHVMPSRHGVKLSSSISFRCGCSATCVTLAYSISNELVLGSGSSSKMASSMRMTPP